MRSRHNLARILAVAVAVLTFASCSAFKPDADPSTAPSSSAVTVGEAPGTGNALAGAVTGENLMARLLELERLTLSADGNRGPGSAGYAAAASYIEDELRATGFYEVRRQPFTIQRPHPGASKLVDDTGRVVNQIPLSFSPGTPVEGISARLVVPRDGDGCDVGDWGSDVAGQIGLVERGGCAFTVLNEAAADAGARMVVVSNDRDGGLYGTLGSLRPQYIPSTGITRTEGRLLREQLATGAVDVWFTFEQRIESFDTFNLLAETRGGDGSEVVMAGAHLDSVPVGPGINDNGSGSMILLETARQLAARPDMPRNKVRFAWWSGEEWGLLGSLHWVNGLVDDDPSAITRLAAYINVDMVASPNYVIGVYDGDASTFPGEDLPAGSAALERLYASYFDSIGQPWVDVEMGGSSDHVAFMPSGVPVGGLFTGSSDTKTAAEERVFGGTRDESYDDNYHQPTDTFANVNPRALEINGKASAFVIGSLADDTSLVTGGAGRPRTPTRAEGFGYAGTV